MSINKKALLRELNSRIKARFLEDLKEIVLFGSQVYGNKSKDSDYDILIILKKKLDWKAEREISDICFEIDLKYNIITDTHIIGESELNTLRGKQPIYINAIQNGIHL
jgi:predicted nucleotidyltransferase